ncbi:MAG: hypothetical protein V4508_03710 [Pseudomonadota bacterium]
MSPLRILLNLVLALSMLMPTGPAQTAPAPQLVLAAPADLMRTPEGAWLSLIYTDALGQLGYRLVVGEYPLARGLALVESGKVDGLLQRAAAFGKLAPALVRVSESHFSAQFAAYGLGSYEGIDGWQSLAGRALRLTCRRGIALCATELGQSIGQDKVAQANTTELGLREVLNGRTDLFLDSMSAVEPQLSNDEFRGTGLHAVGMLSKTALHVYLNAKHAALAPRLARVLKKMKDDGVVEKYRVQSGRAP